MDDTKYTRYWASWYSGCFPDEGYSPPPFPFWVAEFRDRPGSAEAERDDCQICALLDAESTEDVWDLVQRHFPGFEVAFILPRPPGYLPGPRFVDPEAYCISPIDSNTSRCVVGVIK